MVEIKTKLVLCDIEGTTTSISFVKDILFPYAKQNTKTFLEETWNDATTQAIIGDLQKLPIFKEFLTENGIFTMELQQLTTIENMTRFVNYLIDKDLKLGPLKNLQGLVWAKGYTSGSIKGHIYPDVPDAFKHWKNAGIQIAIYSSGSVKAQQLLFGQTVMGDLLDYISRHFDTAIGHKQDMQSYLNIANELNINSSEILFLTDIIKEAEAARSAGMQTVILSRPGNASLTDDEKTEFTIVTDFAALKLVAT